MPKIIQPRRHSKSISVEDFWSLREQQKERTEQKQSEPIYKEEEVENRHRYLRPSEQAKRFNPLAYTFRRETSVVSCQAQYLTETKSANENTHVHQYLDKVHYRVTPAIMTVKGYTFGLKSIVHNIDKIYAILLENLQYEDSWHLLQAVIKDTKAIRFDMWLRSGLAKLVGKGEPSMQEEQGYKTLNIYGRTFNQKLFRNLFDTLCLFLQTFYDQILLQIEQFILVFSRHFLLSSNKHISKFSMQVLSYLLNNIQDDKYMVLIRLLSLENSHNKEKEKIPVSELLLQRLNVLKGCLTAKSMGQLVEQLTNLPKVLAQVYVDQRQYQQNSREIITGFLAALLSKLESKNQNSEEQILFNMHNVLQTLIELCRSVKLQPLYLMEGLSRYFTIDLRSKNQFIAFNQQQAEFLEHTYQLVITFIQDYVSCLPKSSLVIRLIAFMVQRKGDRLYYNQSVIEYCRSAQQTDIRLLLDSLLEIQANLNKVSEMALLICRKQLSEYFKTESSEISTDIIYRLLMVVKKTQVTELISLKSLNVTSDDIIFKARRIIDPTSAIVFARTLCFMQFKLNSEQHQVFQQLYTTLISPFQEQISKLLKNRVDHLPLSGQQFYDSANFSEQTIIYSHNEIEWLMITFNIEEAFELLSTHINENQLASQLSQITVWHRKLWSRIMVNRVSMIKNAFIEESLPVCLNMLQSRIRTVRLEALQKLNHYFNMDELQKEQSIILKLAQIDAENIDLQSQRQVKRLLTIIMQQLQPYIQNVNQKNQHSESQKVFVTSLLKWSIGFAFTGFRLISEIFVTYFANLMQISIPQSQSGETLVAEQVMPLLQYYNYRHSRVFESFVHNFDQQTTISNSLLSLMQTDFHCESINTVEWIGLQRIADAIKASNKEAKNNLKQRLARLVDAYFQIEFNRQRNSIIAAETENTHDSNLQPIKIRFLIIMLKITPSTITPPFSCLHFTREEFLAHPRIRAIKQHNWEAIWEKKKCPKQSRDIQESGNSTICFENVSEQEQRLYLNYLWRDILQANNHRRRAIIEHIRNYLPTQVPYLFQLFFDMLCLTNETIQRQDGQDGMSDEQSGQIVTKETIVKRISKLNRNVLLNAMYILKSLLSSVKIHFRSGDYVDLTVHLICSLLTMFYYSPSGKHIDKDDHAEQEGSEAELSSSQSQANSEDQGQRVHSNINFRQHRKQLQKLLQVLFTHHELESSLLTQLFSVLTNPIVPNQFAKTTRTSVPGVMIVFKIVSESSHSLTLLLKGQFRLLDLLAAVLKQDQDGKTGRPQCLKLAINILANVLAICSNKIEDESQQITTEEKEIVKNCVNLSCNRLMSAILSFMQAKCEPIPHKIRDKRGKKQKSGEQQTFKDQTPTYENYRNSPILLEIIANLMDWKPSLDPEWQTLLWKQLQNVSKQKSLHAKFHDQLGRLINIVIKYISLHKSTSDFSHKIITLIPHIKEASHRANINKLVLDNYTLLGLHGYVCDLVLQLTKVVKNGLTVQMDYASFFQAINLYCSGTLDLTLFEHQYFAYNILAYVAHQELSVRKAVISANRYMLKILALQIDAPTLKIVNSTLRIILDRLNKPNVIANQAIFWSVISCAAETYRWITKYCQQGELYRLFSKMLINFNNEENSQQSSENDFFLQIASLSQANKLKGLKLMIAVFKESSKQITDCVSHSSFPHPIQTILFPILQYLILHPLSIVQGSHAAYTMPGNLSSTLSLVSLQAIGQAGSLCSESIIRKELKRLVSKLKFEQSYNKKNVMVIKIISELVDNIPSLEKCTDHIKRNIKEFGFDEFHRKITDHTRKAVKEGYLVEGAMLDEDLADEQEKFPDFYDNLEELEAEEAINRNFMKFSKKIMEFEDEELETDKPNAQGQNQSLIRFLRYHILVPLKIMLFFESRTRQESKTEEDKGRTFLSVAVTKLLIRFPLQVFYRQFQKVVSKLGRSLKKKQQQVRDNARKCLAEIARVVGPEMLYSIVMELKFHLRDNFEGHIFNFTVYYILEQLDIQNGQVDYCLPLILPMVVDEVFGKTAEEKSLVDLNQIPTLNIESKKRKGNELLSVLCRNISPNKVTFIVDYLEKYLRMYLVSEANLTKYDLLVNNITNGLAKNVECMQPANAELFLKTLSASVFSLKGDIKLYNFDQEKLQPDCTIQTMKKGLKQGHQQTFLLQEETGRNGSIFRRMTAQIAQKRNEEIIINSLMQFYLSLTGLFVKKQIFALATVCNDALASDFLRLLEFVTDCLQHRDNRIVRKCMKILHLTLLWKIDNMLCEQFVKGMKNLRKRVTKSILSSTEKLTAADEDLVKESFTILNDLFSEVTITKNMLPSLITIIKLHTSTTEEMYTPEPYRLLKTVILKCTSLIYNPLLLDVHDFVRVQMVATNSKEIRDICKSICGVYLRDKASLQLAIDTQNVSIGFEQPWNVQGIIGERHKKNKNVHNSNKKSKSHVSHDQKAEHTVRRISYSSKMKQELMFYLSNLDAHRSEAQLSVLQLIELFYSHRTREEVIESAELTVMTLLTAIANTAEPDNRAKMSEIILRLLNTVDNGKLLAMADKAMLWMAVSAEKVKIRICGSYLFLLILQTDGNKFHLANFMNRYVIGANRLLSILTVNLDQQLQTLQRVIDHKKAAHKEKENPLQKEQQWLKVIDAIEQVSQEYHYTDNQALLHQLTAFKKLQQHNQSKKQLMDQAEDVFPRLWLILHCFSQKIVELAINILIKHPDLSNLLNQYVDQNGQAGSFTNDKKDFSFKRTISDLLFNHTPADTIISVVNKLIDDQTPIIQMGTEEIGDTVLMQLVSLLCNLCSKALGRPKVYEQTLPFVYDLINKVLMKDSTFQQNGHQIVPKTSNRTVILGNNHYLRKLIEITCRVSRNELIKTDSKYKNEQTIEAIKEHVGVAEYYRLQASVEQERKLWKAQQKSQLAELAITDQQAYAEIKAGKKRKF